MPYNIPNALTSLRILLVPVFVLAFYFPAEWSNTAATLIFSLAAVTDWFDGYLARRLNQTSAFGAFLDPVADKIMVAVALVLLVDQNPTEYPGVFMSIAAAIIIGREITISALREWMAEVGARQSVAVSIIGKVKTTAQMLALIFLIYADTIYSISTVQAGFILLYVAVFLTLWSMVDYISAALPALQEK
jgi:CDP-diacylglycerol--glycerol-3-phosphate 3-phosphatidyltransferase/cardiolipin synthase